MQISRSLNIDTSQFGHDRARWEAKSTTNTVFGAWQSETHVL